MNDLYRQAVLVTGASSMIGECVVNRLKKRRVAFIDVTGHEDCDHLDLEQSREKLAGFPTPYVFHLAGFNGGIAFNKENPDLIFERTVRMGLNVLQAAKETDVYKVVSVLPSCAYPDLDDEFYKEEDFWNGRPHPSVDCHGLAKRMLHAYSLQLAKLDMVAPCAIVNNSFGPFDKFDEQRSKVVGGLIKRFCDAADQNLSEVVCWGSGKPEREFIYCKDVGELLVRVMEHYDETEIPINITSGNTVTIKQLSETIAKLSGFKGKIVWDTSKQDGQLRKSLSMDRLQQSGLLDDFSFTPLEEALGETIEWYRSSYKVEH